MTVKYKIKMLSDWHCGSGLDSGADADLLVIKDENNLPYIPGKTIKGLLRDALLDMLDVGKVEQSALDTLFGKVNEDKSTSPGKSSFYNAELPAVEKNEIVMNSLSTHLYRNVASTSIDEKGVANQGSLRTMEVCIPMTLEGEIECPVDQKDILEKAMKWVRHLGSSRNRGLGRCQWTITA